MGLFGLPSIPSGGDLVGENTKDAVVGALMAPFHFLWATIYIWGPLLLVTWFVIYRYNRKRKLRQL